MKFVDASEVHLSSLLTRSRICSAEKAAEYQRTEVTIVHFQRCTDCTVHILHVPVTRFCLQSYDIDLFRILLLRLNILHENMKYKDERLLGRGECSFTIRDN